MGMQAEPATAEVACGGCTPGGVGAADGGLVVDPVCGMQVDLAKTDHRLDYQGKTYGFCSSGCRSKFAGDPEGYLSGTRQAAANDDPTAIYTCSMDPEVEQVGPGTCPICGMALEPKMVSLDAAPNHELLDMRRRFWIGLSLTVPLMVVAMAPGLLTAVFGQAFDSVVGNWLQLVLATPVVLWCGWPFFVRAWASFVDRNLNMFSLIGIGVAAAYAFSVLATIAPGLFPAAAQTAGGVGVYFEAAAAIIVLVLLGQVLELRAREATGEALKSLLRLAPETAVRIDAAGAHTEVSLDAVVVGDRLLVRPGTRVPVDGTVLTGSTFIDEAMVTGESIPVEKMAGDTVIGGTMNGVGSFEMSAEKVGSDTMLSRIVQLVAEAQRTRAPIQRIADRVAGWFVPAVIAVSAIAFASWLLIGPAPALAHALLAAVSVLIIACPCALGLATPMSVMVGTGRGAQSGILIRSAEALEQFANVDTLVIDKTGTLTEGKPAVTQVVVAAGQDEGDVLRLAASLERASEHPLAAAIVTAATERGLPMASSEDFLSSTGFGVSGTVDGRLIVVGNERFLADRKIDAVELAERADVLRADGATVVHVAADGRYLGFIAVADPIKASSESTLKALRREGVKVMMLTGDNEVTAAAIARRLDVDDHRANVLPEEKAAFVRQLRESGHVVAMAGDGTNDAPALAAADVGLAMGTGTDVAIESAAVTLVRGDLAAILRARRLSRATMRNIKQNLFFAFVYNGIGIPIAAGVLYPVFGLLLSPMLAAAAMSLSSVSVIGNALRLRFARI